MPGSSSSPALPARSFAEQVIALGAVAYLEKGADPDTIVATIQQALASTNGVPEQLTTPA
jgi:DNA-binding NarL/FixJ family response regulator